MTDHELDQMLRTALSPCTAGEGRKEAVRKMLEVEPMTHTKKKNRVLAASLAACFLLAAAAGAGAMAFRAYTRSVVNRSPYSYAQRETVEKAVGFPVRLPQTLLGGFAFQEMNIGEETACDGEDKPLFTYKNLMAVYADPAGRSVFVTLVKTEDVLRGTRKVPAGEAAVTVREVPYRLVPPDYVPSPEEKAREAAGELMLAYGNDRVEDRVLCSAAFDQDGVSYTLVSFDGVTREELQRAAEEILHN